MGGGNSGRRNQKKKNDVMSNRKATPIHVNLKDMLVRLKFQSTLATYRHACKSRNYSKSQTADVPGSKAGFNNDTLAPEIVRMGSIVALLGFHIGSHWSAIMEIFRPSHKWGPWPFFHYRSGCWSDLGARCCKPACWILEIILIMSKVISESSVLI